MAKKSVLKKCSGCGAKIRLKARYCHLCGRPVELLQDNIRSSELIESIEGFEKDKSLETDKNNLETAGKNLETEEETLESNKNITTKLDAEKLEAELAKLKKSAESESEDEIDVVDEEKGEESESDYSREEIGRYRTNEIEPMEEEFFAAEEPKDFTKKKTEVAYENEETFAKESEITDAEEAENSEGRPADKPIEKPEIPFSSEKLVYDEETEKDIEKATVPFDEALASGDLTVSDSVDSGVSVETKYEQEVLSETQVSRRFNKHRKRRSQIQEAWVVSEGEGNFLYLISAIIFSLISLVLLLLMIWLK